MDAVIDSQNYVATAPRTVQEAVNIATGKIVGNVGGYVVLNSSSGGKYPDEILVMDAPRIEDAVSVWRWNKSGLGHSSSGYNGPYTLAALDDGSFVADVIKSGTLGSLNGMTTLNMSTGALDINSAEGGGMHIYNGAITVRRGGEDIGLIHATNEFGISVAASAGKKAALRGPGGTYVGDDASATTISGSAVAILGKMAQWVQSTDFGGYVLVSK